RERNADLAGLAVGRIFPADLIGGELSPGCEALPCLGIFDAGDGLGSSRAHVLSHVLQLDSLLGYLCELILFDTTVEGVCGRNYDRRRQNSRQSRLEFAVGRLHGTTVWPESLKSHPK